jgi:hypothetical protein
MLWKLPTTTALLLTLCATFWTKTATAQCEEHNAFIPGCFCYTQQEVNGLAKGIVELQKCQLQVTEQKRLIDERLVEFKGPQLKQLWWQEPAWVGTGLVVSFSAGMLLVFAVR